LTNVEALLPGALDPSAQEGHPEPLDGGRDVEDALHALRLCGQRAQQVGLGQRHSGHADAGALEQGAPREVTILALGMVKVVVRGFAPAPIK